MPLTKSFTAHLNWNYNSEFLKGSDRKMYRNHNIVIDGKSNLVMSAAKDFKGDGTKHNPEDMLLSAICSCHFMSYLFVCTQNGITILSYKDYAVGRLIVHPDASGEFEKVELAPQVLIQSKDHLELAYSLHAKASQLCFIARSCKFPIIHKPIIKYEN